MKNFAIFSNLAKRRKLFMIFHFVITFMFTKLIVFAHIRREDKLHEYKERNSELSCPFRINKQSRTQEYSLF